MKRHPERGYALVTMLVLILSIGGGWIGVTSGSSMRGVTSTPLSLKDRQGLVDARQSLLSYSAIYPYLYGPTGAGPAHLPCPDSDGYRQSAMGFQSGKNQSRDGPNPPCAATIATEGMLPRHIVLPGYRYIFHAESWQLYDYRVAGDLVNNPLNRIVNLSRLYSDDQTPAATISLSRSKTTSPDAMVTISGKALARATVGSIAAWIIQRSSQVRSKICLLPASRPKDEVTDQGGSSVDVCPSPGSMNPECTIDTLLTHVLDVPHVNGHGCLFNSLELNTIEGVPALRHWFIRNEWYKSIKLSYYQDCEDVLPAASHCDLYLLPDSRRIKHKHQWFIELFWTRRS
ncbi:MAG: hypothetical protein AB8B87_13850 [Granulosicoccus sp.]